MRRFSAPVALVVGGAALAAIMSSLAAPAVTALPPIPSTDFHLYKPGTPCQIGPGPLGRIVAEPDFADPSKAHHLCLQAAPDGNGYYE